MKYINIHPESPKELAEMWEEVKSIFTYAANRPKERKKIKYLRSDDVLSSSVTFTCGLCVILGISPENATHSIEDSFLPRAHTRRGKNGTQGFICRHCHDSGF